MGEEWEGGGGGGVEGEGGGREGWWGGGGGMMGLQSATSTMDPPQIRVLIKLTTSINPSSDAG